MIDTKPSATTTDSGIRAPSDESSLTVGPTGPTMLHDRYLVEARTLYRDVMTDPDREHLAANIVGHVRHAVNTRDRLLDERGSTSAP
jgi:catalase